jgi:hypothetical protein
MREEEEKMEEEEDGKNQGSSSTWDLGRTTKRGTPLEERIRGHARGLSLVHPAILDTQDSILNSRVDVHSIMNKFNDDPLPSRVIDCGSLLRVSEMVWTRR